MNLRLPHAPLHLGAEHARDPCVLEDFEPIDAAAFLIDPDEQVASKLVPEVLGELLDLVLADDVPHPSCWEVRAKQDHTFDMPSFEQIDIRSAVWIVERCSSNSGHDARARELVRIHLGSPRMGCRRP